MREILFRGKRTDNGEWVEGFYTLYANNCGVHPCILTGTEQGCVIPQFVIPKTVGQFTGLTDKNGKKIFDGDVVTNPEGDIGRVTWYEEHCAFMIYSITENKVYWLFDNDFSLIEIIGNIHDNPELLKGGER